MREVTGAPLLADPEVIGAEKQGLAVLVVRTRPLAIRRVFCCTAAAGRHPVSPCLTTLHKEGADVEKTLDTMHHFRAQYTRASGRCRIRVYRPAFHKLTDYHPGEPGRPALVVATHPWIDAGVSVTNAAEELATYFFHQLGRPASFRWIEHYPAKKGFPYSLIFWETFDDVTFTRTSGDTLVDPRWRSITRDELEAVIKQPFPPETVTPQQNIEVP